MPGAPKLCRAFAPCTTRAWVDPYSLIGLAFPLSPAAHPHSSVTTPMRFQIVSLSWAGCKRSEVHLAVCKARCFVW